MALQIKLKHTGTNPEGTKVFIEDITGVYDAITNLGGYGLPNTAREDVAIYILPIYKGTKGNSLITIAAYNPEVANTFTVNVPKDGWLDIRYAVLAKYDELLLQDYVVGDVYHDSSTYLPVIIKGTSNEEGFVTKVAETITLSDLVLTAYSVSGTEIFFIANNSKTKLRMNALISELILEGASFTDKQLIRYKDNYNVVRAILQGAIYEFCRGNKYVAQKNIEFLNTNDYVLD